ncbi:ABC transporter permease [Actinospica sp. MGRD01-02]|uniref:ABC transporter permease n=1 Tax=Actinospica acidithermotolerans TaxID=2828514 RepID=A0A941ENZ9_9ACTN|nr:ABC transporter permease [Actinospica acidithermotolerans]MBR7831094.1 ABC transporter permease [Actinospica acidithermotolerans]
MSAFGWGTSWRAALRISRREVLRHKARNALIVAMLGLPVFGVTALDTILTSTQDLTAQERVTRAVGGTDAFIDTTEGMPIYQSADVNADSIQVDLTQNPPTLTSAQLASDKAIRAVLPHATLLAEDVSSSVIMHGSTASATSEYYRLDVSDSALNGAIDLSAGRRPTTASEVDLSPVAAADLGVKVGDRVTLDASSARDGKSATFTVVGLMRQPSQMNADAVYALPGAPAVTGEGRAGWFVKNSGGVTWSEVEQLNKSGFRVISRDVALDPPAASQIPSGTPSYLFAEGYGTLGIAGYRFVLGGSDASVAITAMVAGIALLEVVLLAGPAFAVSARRREREYAMLGAVGASDVQIRRIVLADGLVLGAIAGVVGAALGFATGAAALAFIARHTSQLPGAVHVSVVSVAVVALLAIVLGMCAALAPAISVARRDIVGALNGRRGAVTRRVRVGRVVLGAALICVGLVTEYFVAGSSLGFGAVDVVAGIALVEIGGILCTPAVIALAARWGGILPLSPRLALRDGARNSSRTTPAVAAMFAAVAGAVAAGVWLESGLAQERANYQPSLLGNQVAIVGVADAKQAAEITAKLRGILPVTGTMLTGSVGASGAPDSWQVAFEAPGDDFGCPEATNNAITTVCGNASYGGGTVQNAIGGPAEFREITGFDDARADAVLDQGGVVLFTQGIVQNGKTTVVVPADGKLIKKTERLTVPAVYIPVHDFPSPGYLLSAKAARSLGIADGTKTLLLDLSSHATTAQQATADQVIAGFGVHSGLTVEDGLRSEYGLANVVVLLIAVFVAFAAGGIATGLALADGQADQDTLVAVGGSPWTRRRLAGSTALVVTGLGVLIGVPIGLLIAAGLIRVSNLARLDPNDVLSIDGAQRVFTVPWLDLGAVALAVPLLTALGAALLSRSRAHGSGRTVG